MGKNTQAGSRRATAPLRRRRGNGWLAHEPASDWPLALDLGKDIGSRPWGRGLASLLAGVTAALVIGLALPRGGDDAETAGPAFAFEASAAEAAEATPAIPAPDALPPDWRPPERPLVLRAEGLAAAGVAEAAEPRRTHVVIRRGDTLMDAALRAGADRRAAHAAITALRALFDPRRLDIGQAVELAFAPAGDGDRLLRLAVRNRFDERVAAERTGPQDFEAVRESLPTTELLDFKSGRIDDSLYLSARRAGVPVETIIELIRLYSFNVDFQREIWPGDRFELLYERRVTAEDGRIENGGVLYAKLTLRGRELPLYRHRPDGEENVDYFDAAGESVRKALMKTPLDGARLTSRFGPRKHPILGYVRTHQGADFGAPTGTPVYAAGDGVIARASRYGAYGNHILIRHNSTEYKTAYAHLSGYARGIRAGVRVRQGQVIGYVGATGRVTGPHLHYEVFRGDSRIDPLALDLPSGRVLEGAELEAFSEARDRLDADRLALGHAWRVAQAIEPERSGSGPRTAAAAGAGR